MAPTPLPPLDKLDPAHAWQPWEPTGDDPWGPKWAGHLYRRAAFGPSPAELRRAVQAGHRATLDLLLNGEPRAASLLPFLTKMGEQVVKNKTGNAPELRAWWL